MTGFLRRHAAVTIGAAIFALSWAALLFFLGARFERSPFFAALIIPAYLVHFAATFVLAALAAVLPGLHEASFLVRMSVVIPVELLTQLMFLLPLVLLDRRRASDTRKSTFGARLPFA